MGDTLTSRVLDPAVGGFSNPLNLTGKTAAPPTMPPMPTSVSGALQQGFGADIDLGRAQSAQRQTTLAGEQKVLEEKAKADDAAYEPVKQMTVPKFVPTQETATDLAGLFGMLGVLGTAMGGKGKAHGMDAMSAMTGMMTGYTQGRKDLYENELSKFNAANEQFKNELSMRMSAYNAVLKKNQTNVDASLKGVALLATQFDDQVTLAAAKSGIYSKMLSVLQAQQQLGQQHTNSLDLLKKKHEYDEAIEAKRLETARAQHVNLRKEQEGDWVRQQGPDAMVIYSQFGIPVTKVAAEKIGAASIAIGEGLSIIDEVNKLPENMGRSGQVKSFLERYITSWTANVRDGKEPEPSSELSADEKKALSSDQGAQDALIFAKRYASYLVKYEQSLAGGSRGFTVSFQNRFNALMAQGQFTRAGMIKLLGEHVKELSSAAVTPGIPNLDFAKLAEMSIQRKDQSSSPDVAGSAARGYALAFPKGGAAGGAGSQTQDSPPAAYPSAKKALDGKWYISDPNRTGKYLEVP